MEDLEQAGAEGFLYALDRYRPEEGTKFSTVLEYGVKSRLRPLLHLESENGRMWARCHWMSPLLVMMEKNLQERIYLQMITLQTRKRRPLTLI